MVRASEARRIILDSLRPGSHEICELSQTYGRVLAEQVIASHDVPGFDNSSMDGFAVRSQDVRTAGESSSVTLSIQEEIAAGSISTVRLKEGYAIRVMTGAPIPPGADAVVEQELTEGRNGSVSVRSAVQVGRNVRPRGDDIRAGSVVLGPGSLLTSARVGVLASLGIAAIKVYRKPKVAVLTTGNELIDVSATPDPGQVRNSNAYSLAGLVKESGGEVVDLGIARDDPDELASRIREGLRYDALITSGGVSVGKYDYVLQALQSEGVEIRFWKVNIKPGRPFAFGVMKGAGGFPIPVFALPGNPVSSVVVFLQFARYGLERLRGNEEFVPLRTTAILREAITKKDGKRHFVRGVARNEKGGLSVVTTGTQSSGVLTSLSKANCLIIIPEEAGNVPAGSSVEIELL